MELFIPLGLARCEVTLVSALKMLAALAIVVSPASLGIAAYTGAVDLGLGTASESGFNGEIVEEFTGSFDEEVTDGTLDLRVDRGAVRVIGWDKPEYRVVVVEEPHEEADVSDHETTVEFDDRSSGSTLDLKAVADREGTYRVQQDGDGVRTGGHVDLAIIAWVPASADYTKIRACSGQDPFISGAVHTVGEVLGEVSETEQEDRRCVPAQDRPSTMGQISINHAANHTGLNVTSGVTGLDGGLLWAFTGYGDIQVEEAGFETVRLSSGYGDVALDEVSTQRLDIETGYGDIYAEALDTEDLAIDTGYGDVHLEGTVDAASLATDYGDVVLDGTFDDLELTTDYGDVTGQLDIRASGTYEIATDYGDVGLSVPARQAIGYDVQAATDHGDVEVDLADAGDQGGAEDEDDDDNEEDKHVRTQGYEDRAIQVAMDIETDYGDITVGHDTVDLEEDEEDREDSRSTEPKGPVSELHTVTSELG